MALPEAPSGALLQGHWLPTPKRPSEEVVVVVWFQSCQVDPSRLAKITKNRAHPGTDPTWQFLGRTSQRWLPMVFCCKVGSSDS
ncbi:hypothetical protein CRG98_006157 [Punica granatum]|uniref:Uncharacterized protein n=1 Tax=Punica granatum TaxID=22663 RepID=A0A2I0KY93_PUNGR|nr:hypothetical protein CRG98_006157 [Punica granatum]